MFRKPAMVAALACLCTLFCGGVPQAAAQAANGGISSLPAAVAQITRPINNARLSPMATSVPAQATPANDVGAVASRLRLDHLLLLLHRPIAQEQALQGYMQAQQNPNSPDYHHWLTPAQFGQYGLAPSDIDTLTAWLRAQGFSVNQVYPSRVMIDFSGTAGQVQAAFKTAIHSFNVNGTAHIANTSVPKIPSALAPAVVGIVSLNDFRPHTNYKRHVAPDYTINQSFQALVPADLQTIYNITPLLRAPTAIDGSGQTIALIEDTDVYSATDITTFRSTFGLPPANFTQVHPGTSTGANGCIAPGDNSDDIEAELDVEWAGVSAPGAALQLVSCANTQTTFGGLIAMSNLLAETTPPSIWSVSYGFCEAANGEAANAAYASTYQQAAAAGISVFVSSGDEGAASCDANQPSATHGIGVSGFASTPYNVAVGGTDFGDAYAGTTRTYWSAANGATFGSARSYINEIPWNDSCASQLLANGGAYYASLWSPFATTYGAGGFCNDPIYGEPDFTTTGSGSGGPSGCATGTPSIPSPVVSGSCAGMPKPWWQTGLLGNPNDGVRDIPDVSLFAASGVWGHYYIFCYTNHGGSCSPSDPSSWAGSGGTSFASPIMAGIQALVNQKIGTKVGNPNPIYYQLAAAEYGAGGSASCDSTLGNGVASTCIFYDVTQGDMDVNCGPDADPGANNALFNCYMPGGSHGVLSTSAAAYQPAYGTTTGWDFATGIGSVNAANLVNHWPVAGAATQLVFRVEPNAAYGANLPINVAVSVEDASGKRVTGNTSAITLALSGGTGGATLSGTTPVNAVSGVATFVLSVDLSGTAYNLNATDGSLTAATSSAFAITNPAQTLTFSTPPVTSEAGAAIPVVVHVADATSAPVAGDAITLSISTNPGGSTLTGGGPVVTDASGNATFSGVSLNLIGTGYVLTATDSSATPITQTSSAFDITAGPAQTLTFLSSQPAAANYTAGAAIPMAVQVIDAYGNPVAGESVSVAITSTTATAPTLSGTLTTSTDATGTATFGNPTPVSLNRVGSYQFGATDTTTSTASSAISPQLGITAGLPTQLVFTTEPVDVIQGTTMPTAVQVAEEDAQGNVETSDSASNIAFTIPACNGPFTLGNITLNQGVASLPDSPRYYTVANRLQMTAGNTAVSMPTIASIKFNVTANADLVFSDGFDGCRP